MPSILIWTLVITTAVVILTMMRSEGWTVYADKTQPSNRGRRYTRKTLKPEESPLPPGRVRFFENANFQGKIRDFPLGTKQASLSKGFLNLGLGYDRENDAYSSAIVPEGMVVIAYEHPNYKGRSLTLYAGRHANLGIWGMNDTISSLVVGNKLG